MKIAVVIVMMFESWTRLNVFTKTMFLLLWILITHQLVVSLLLDLMIELLEYFNIMLVRAEKSITPRKCKGSFVSSSAVMQATLSLGVMTPTFVFGRLKHLNSFEFFCRESAESTNIWKLSRIVTSIFLRLRHSQA